MTPITTAVADRPQLPVETTQSSHWFGILFIDFIQRVQSQRASFRKAVVPRLSPRFKIPQNVLRNVGIMWWNNLSSIFPVDLQTICTITQTSTICEKKTSDQQQIESHLYYNETRENKTLKIRKPIVFHKGDPQMEWSQRHFDTNGCQ